MVKRGIWDRHDCDRRAVSAPVALYPGEKARENHTPSQHTRDPYPPNCGTEARSVRRMFEAVGGPSPFLSTVETASGVSIGLESAAPGSTRHSRPLKPSGSRLACMLQNLIRSSHSQFVCFRGAAHTVIVADRRLASLGPQCFQNIASARQTWRSD